MNIEEAAANLLSLGISLLFLGWSLNMLIDEIRDYFLDKIQEKRERLYKENEDH